MNENKVSPWKSATMTTTAKRRHLFATRHKENVGTPRIRNTKEEKIGPTDLPNLGGAEREARYSPIAEPPVLFSLSPWERSHANSIPKHLLHLIGA